MNPELRRPVKLDEMTFPFRVDERERIDSEPLHHPQRSWNPSITHSPEDGVSGLRLEGEEVPEVVMCRLAGRHLVVRFRLDGVNKIGELHSILHEEYWNIVSEKNAFGSSGS